MTARAYDVAKLQKALTQHHKPSSECDCSRAYDARGLMMLCKLESKSQGFGGSLMKLFSGTHS